MGEVHAAYDRRLRRPVAVKTLRADLPGRDGLVRRFEDEGRIAARLVHPHAVAVFDVGEDRGIPYLVMELVEGATLADEIARGPLDADRALRIALEVLGALGAAHAVGIVHRDVKPANVILTGDGTAKVTDFGIAKIAGDDVTAQIDGTTGGILGTAAYIAPERLRGEPATARSDLYAVGAVLYEALCGEAPFRADTPAGVIWAISTGQRQPLDERRPDLPAGLVGVVETALAPQPGDRFADAPGMAAALAAVEGQAAEAHRTAPDAAPTVRVRSVPGTEVLPREPIGTHEVIREPLAPTPAPDVPAWRRRPLVLAAVAVLVLVLAVVALGPAGDGTSDSSGDDTAEPATEQPAAGSIPAELSEVLDALEETLR
jgi:serine/threonine protein kinase